MHNCTCTGPLSAPTVGEVVVRRVLLLEPSPVLRGAVEEILAAEGYQVVRYDSLERLLAEAEPGEPEVALVAWQTLQGLLTDERRHELAVVAARVRMVVMVPRRWLRALQPADFGIAGLLPKPFERDELLACLEHAGLAEPSHP